MQRVRPSAADRQLVLGVLALHAGFINREALLAGVDAWLAHREQPLADHLVRLGHLTQLQRQLLDPLAQEHIRAHGGDPRRSLEALQGRDFGPLSHMSLIARERTDGNDRTVAPTPTSDLRPPARYRILHPHAEGGLGQVFVARDEEVGREVALKEIKPRWANHAASRARFTREAAITGGLEHPGIVPVYGLGAHEDGRPYYAMRFIRGSSLKEAIEAFHESPAGKKSLALADQNLELRRLMARLIDVCQAIDYAHSRGVLHRDLKPGNIMLGRYGETLVVDWGLAKALGSQADAIGAEEEQPLLPAGDSAPTRLGAAIGTPGYMSPEQAEGRIAELGPASDIFSLGATLYHLLIGVPPYAEGDLLQLAREADFPRPRSIRPDVPRPLEAVCLKAMELRPGDRYASARDLADELERWLAGEPLQAYREQPYERAARWARKHRTWVTAGALALTLVTAVTTVALLVVSFQNWEIANLAAAEQRDRQLAEEKQRDAEQARDRETQARRDVDNARGQAHAVRVRLAEIIDQLGEDIYRTRRHRPLLESGITNYRDFLDLEHDVDEEPLLRARFQSKLATLLEALDDYPRAKQAYQTSIAQYEALLADGTGTNWRQLQSELGTAYGNLGAMYVQTPETLSALSALDKAIAIQKKLAQRPDARQADRRELARHYYNRGYIRAHHGLAGATKDLLSAVELQRDLAAAAPQASELLLELAVMEIELGVRQAHQSRQTGADATSAAESRDLVQSGVTTLESLVRSDQSHLDYRKELADGYAELGQAQCIAGDLVAAESSLAKSIDGFNALLANFSSDPDFRRGLALAHAAQGAVKEQSGDAASAAEHYQAAVELQERLVAEYADRSLYWTDAAKTWTSIAELRLKQQDAAGALAAMKSAALKHRQAWRLTGFGAELRPAVYEAYIELAKIAIRAGDHASLAELGQSHAALRPESKLDLFDAAKLMAVAAALADKDQKLDSRQRSMAADQYAFASVELLLKAVEHGFRDDQALGSEPDRAAIRSRPGFAELLARLRKP